VSAHRTCSRPPWESRFGGAASQVSLGASRAATVRLNDDQKGNGYLVGALAGHSAFVRAGVSISPRQTRGLDELGAYLPGLEGRLLSHPWSRSRSLVKARVR
jgi:hypothetical protein